MKFFCADSTRQSIARFLLLLTTCQISSPLASWALTSGPVQPEFAGFESVNTKDLVNKFTGDFTYTLPLLEVPGPAGSSYPVTLGYRSGTNTEDEASWVGYGWNLNPGAINRNVRGLPDDFYKEELTYTNQKPENFTLTLGTGAGLELFSGDVASKKVYKLGGLQGNASIRYNNSNGFGYEEGFGITLGKGLISLNVQQTDGRRTFSGRVNPMQLIASFQKDNYSKGEAEKLQPKTFAQCVGQSLQNSALRAINAGTSINLAGGNHGIIDFNEGSSPTVISQYIGRSFNMTVGAAANPGPIPFGANFNLTGSYSSQKPVKTDLLPAYGYLYAGEATAEKNGDGPSGKRITNLLTDYYIENDGPYEHRDILLGVPFSNADNYSVSGEGIGGGFQLQHSQTGEFGPNSKSSPTTIYNFGADVSLGWTFGAGAKVSLGRHSLEESSWDEAQGAKLLPFSKLGAGSYFRFTNDLGGTSERESLSDDPVTATLGINNSLDKAKLSTIVGNPLNQPKQGSHIGQHTVAQTARPAMFRYCRRADIDALRERPKSGNAAGGVQNQAIAEFRVTNEGGQQYTYGLPLYAQNETTMQYGVQGVNASDIKQNYLVYSAEDYTNENKTKVGHTRNGAYATSYLLTEITSPDYVDRNLNGPDEADFGGYTTFSYVKTYGGRGSAGNTWYRWRLPYTGMQYQMGSLSATNDDMGSVAAGDKEICYLQAIHTKTHTAIFRISARSDGREATTNEPDALQNEFAKGTAGLSKLDRIDLYANTDVMLVPASSNAGDTRRIWVPKNSTVIPIKSVQLTYDYSLCQQTPNSTSATKGKLTLQQVRTSYNGVTLARPYEFKYTYPSYSGTDAYPAKYASFKDKYQYSSGAQNPDYKPFCLDAWGSYQDNEVGKVRHTNLQGWPDQRGLMADVDPAAWQLKRIVLPSGGEIHVQYEPDDYAYVQDQPATALASLINDNTSVVARTEFWLDPTSAGVAMVPSGLSGSPLLLARKKAKQELLTCQRLLQEQYVGTGKKIFFKFLYKLVTTKRTRSENYQQAAPNAVTDCNTDYVSGYVTLDDIQADTTRSPFRLKLVLPSSNDWALPQNVCQDFVQTQRLGRLQSIDGSCSPAEIGIAPNEKDATTLFRQFVDWVARKPSLLGGTNSSICAALQPTLSYFKIPLPTSKRGGGLRVKRLLTFDRGTDLDNEPVLYGSEYEYQAFDKLTQTWRSSGVATTEPGTMRDENALVSYIPRLRQGDLQKVVAGPDRKQSEGPIGESILPAASVGYSRVAVKNIHSGKSNPGYSISEFFTCKDAPMQWRMTSLASQRNYSPIYGLFVNLITDQTWAAQGFSFILNALHGQPKREATYAGNYSDINQQTTSTLISEQVYEYGGGGLVQDEPETGKFAAASPGKEVEVTMAQHAVQDHLNEVSGEGDIQYSPLLFVAGLLWVTGTVSLNRNTADFYSHTTSKVIRYPAIIKRVISAHDGMRDTVENMVFDRYTGRPVAVRSSDGGRGAYWKQTVMASWVYPQLRGKAQNEGLVFLSSPSAPAWKTIRDAGNLYLQAQSRTMSDCQWLASVRKGDVLALGQEDTPAHAQEFVKALYFADAPDIARKRIRLYPYAPTGNSVPSPGDVSGVSIIFSGNTNQLQMEAGSTVYHSTVRKTLDFTPPVANLDASDPFALALKTAIGNLSSMAAGSASAQTTFTLSGTFAHVNMAGFADRITSSGCRSRAADATVKNLVFLVNYEAPSGSMRLQLMSFELDCDNTGNPNFQLVK